MPLIIYRQSLHSNPPAQGPQPIVERPQSTIDPTKRVSLLTKPAAMATTVIATEFKPAGA